MTSQDGSGSVVGQTEYDAYGREVYASGSDRGDLRFAGAKGYVNDDATGMRMLGARYYLPALGRFLTPDPIGQAGGLNLYAYCGDSPLMRTDPLGLDWLDDAANFFGGWGHALTFGGSGALSQYINRSLGYGEFSYGGGYFTAGEVVGTANQIGIGIAGGARLGIARMAARGSNVAAGALIAAQAADEAWASISGVVRIARSASKAGNYGLGNLTAAETFEAGEAFLGPGARQATGKSGIFVSQDGLRQFRAPSFKPNLGIAQANFETRGIGIDGRVAGAWTSNGHVNVIP